VSFSNYPARQILYLESEAVMARTCEVCGKGNQMGNTVETRGKAKYLGGVGTKVTGISRRKFKPNLQRVKVTTPDGSNRTLRVCTSCLRSGAVRKVVRQRPFRLPAQVKAKG
jgi:large subunit ribosomal protein L28